MLQPFGKRHATHQRVERGHEDAVAAVGKGQSRAGAGHEHAGLRAESAQPLQPVRARRRQAFCELRDLSAVRICRPKGFRGEFRAMGGAKQPRGDWIGPKHMEAVGRPQPDRMRARRMKRQPRIAQRLHLEFRRGHRACRLQASHSSIRERRPFMKLSMAVQASAEYRPSGMAGPRQRAGKQG